MRINIFGLKRREKWEEINQVLYQLWCMNQTDIMLPKFLDKDFKRCVDNIKKKYTFKQICEILDI